MRDNPYVAVQADGRALARQSMKLLIPAGAIGHVIGKQGVEINNIRQVTNAAVDVTKPEEMPPQLERFRFVTLGGTGREVRLAQRAVLQRIAASEEHARERSRLRAEERAAADAAEERAGHTAAVSRIGVPVCGEHEDVMSVTVTIPAALVGRVIGKGGSAIQAIRQSAGCAVDVAAAPLGTEAPDALRRVTIIGTPANIGRAKQMILEQLQVGLDALGVSSGRSAMPAAGAPAPYIVRR